MGTLMKNPNIIERAIGDGNWMLYDVEKGVIHVINQTALEVFQLCNGDLTIEGIIEHLSEKYSITETSSITTDVDEILQSFIELGVLS